MKTNYYNTKLDTLLRLVDRVAGTRAVRVYLEHTLLPFKYKPSSHKGWFELVDSKDSDDQFIKIEDWIQTVLVDDFSENEIAHLGLFLWDSYFDKLSDSNPELYSDSQTITASYYKQLNIIVINSRIRTYLPQMIKLAQQEEDSNRVQIYEKYLKWLDTLRAAMFLTKLNTRTYGMKYSAGLLNNMLRRYNTLWVQPITYCNVPYLTNPDLDSMLKEQASKSSTVEYLLPDDSIEFLKPLCFIQSDDSMELSNMSAILLIPEILKEIGFGHNPNTFPLESLGNLMAYLSSYQEFRDINFYCLMVLDATDRPIFNVPIPNLFNDDNEYISKFLQGIQEFLDQYKVNLYPIGSFERFISLSSGMDLDNPEFTKTQLERWFKTYGLS